jgi:hypothetical protein
MGVAGHMNDESKEMERSISDSICYRRPEWLLLKLIFPRR